MSAKHTILYADDDLDDLFIVKQAFKAYDGEINLLHAYNGIEALKHLEDLHSKGVHPCLVILDINMPGMNGREALGVIRASSAFKNIPVVMFTTSSNQHDKEFARSLNADFITKPLVYSELEELAKSFVSLCDFETKSRSVISSSVS